MNQKEIFLGKEGDCWYQRNNEKLAEVSRYEKNDRLVTDLLRLNMKFESILEVGCSNGIRLEALRRNFAAKCHGIEPSPLAVTKGMASFPELFLRTGTADELPYDDHAFDLFIFGFCLYLCDRSDLFKIASEADRVLKDKGILAILDFHPPFAYRNDYVHFPGVYSYKMDYSRLFSWNPAYSIILSSVFAHQGNDVPGDPDERVAVSLLRKDMGQGFPRNPFSFPR